MSCEKFEKSPSICQKDDWKDEFEKKCEEQNCLRNAIIMAANFDKRKMPDYQYRVRRKKMKEFGEILLKIENEIKTAKNFDNLLKIISSKKIDGIGKLTLYDTATRIGVYLKIYPEKIYLHAGTRIGAENLLGKNKIKGKKYIEKEFLIENCPEHYLSEFQNFSPAYIENILCIRKNDYKNIV